MDGTDSHVREMRNTYKCLFGKPQGKKPIGRNWRRWEDNTKMDLREVGYELVK
jgi:hypothetical protein